MSAPASTRSTAIITGAGGGIGAAIARNLSARGYDLVAVGRGAGALDALAALELANGTRVERVAADVTGREGRAAIVRAAQAARHPVRLLIHAAGVSRFGLFEATSDDAFDATVATNLLAPMQLTHALWPLLRRNGEAAVVAIGSTFGSIGYPGNTAYCASKFGLRGFCEALAREREPDDPDVLYLSPRATRTSLNDAAVDRMNAALKVAVDDPHDVARQVVAAIVARRRRLQLGIPEKLFARLNGALPGLVDRAIAGQRSTVRAAAARTPAEETP